MKLTFWGAAGGVTGSMHLVESGGKRYLLDCGLNQGRRTEAHDMLAPVVEWFKEQPGSVDLKHATILLSDLV